MLCQSQGKVHISYLFVFCFERRRKEGRGEERKEREEGREEGKKEGREGGSKEEREAGMKEARRRTEGANSRVQTDKACFSGVP